MLTFVRQRFVRGALLRDVSGLWIAEAVGLAVTVVEGILVARWLGPRSYGIAALVMGYPALVFAFIDARSAEATVKYLAEFRERKEHERALAISRLGYAIDASISVLTLLLVGATALWAERRIVHASGTAWLLVLYAGALVFRSPAGTARAILATFGRFPTLAVAQAATTVLRAALVLGFVAGGWGVRGVVGGSAIALTLEGIVAVSLAHSIVSREWGREGWLASWSALRGRRRELLEFLIWTDVSSLFGLFAKQADSVILGYLRGPTEVGYYRLARSIASLAGNAVGPLQSVIYPRFARLWGAGDRQKLAATARRIALRLALPLGAAALVSLLVVPAAIRLVVGERFLPAASAAQILVAGGAVWMAFFWIRPLILTIGTVRFWTGTVGTAGLLSLMGYVAVAGRWGFVGVAWVQLLTIGIGVHAVALAHLIRRRRLFAEPYVEQASRA